MKRAEKGFSQNLYRINYAKHIKTKTYSLNFNKKTFKELNEMQY